MNHYPHFGRKVPSACQGDSEATANPFGHIDCPKCREFLSDAVSMKTAGAMTFKEKSKERKFFLKNAASMQEILDQ